MQKTHIYIDVKTRRHVQPNGQPVDRTALYPELERGQWQVLCFEFVSVDEDDAGIVTVSPVSFGAGHSYLLVADDNFADDDNLMLKSLQSSVPFDEADHNSNMMQIEGDWIDGTTADIALGQLSVRVNNDTVKFATVMGDYDRIYSGLYINVKQYTSGIANPSTIAWLNFTGCNTVRDWSSAQYTPNPGTEVISQVKSSLNNSFEFLFDSSDSGEDWHTELITPTDTYFKMRLAGLDMPWSLPKAVPYGPKGDAATITIGSVTQGETPSVSNSGTANDAILDFVLVKGDTGSSGLAATITIGSVTQGETPSVSNSGTANAAILDFVLVKGDTGPAGAGVPSVTSDDVGKVLTVDSAGVWGAAMPAEVTGFIPTSEKGAVNGVAELDSAGKVPASQLPESVAELPSVTSADDGKVLTVDSAGVWGASIPAAELPSVTSADDGKVLTVDSAGLWIAKVLPETSGGIDFSTASPSALGDTAVVGTDTGASRADHVHPNTGLVLASEKGAANGVATLGADGLVPLGQLPESVGGVPEATDAQVAASLYSYFTLSRNKYLSVNCPIAIDADIPAGNVSFKQMYYPEINADPGYSGNPIPKRLVYSPYLLGSYATTWDLSHGRPAIVKLTDAEALDMAFITWWQANSDSNYPIIDMSTGEILSATGNSVIGYEWDKLNVVPESTPHDGDFYVSYANLSYAKQRNLYEGSTAYTGSEGYHSLAAQYTGKWVLCSYRYLYGDRQDGSRVDAYSYVWPDLDMPGQTLNRWEFRPIKHGWTMPSWSDFELSNMGLGISYEAKLSDEGFGVYKSETFVKSEVVAAAGAGADPTPATALENPFVSKSVFYVSYESVANWGWCSNIDWSSLAAALQSIAQYTYKVLEARQLNRFNSYLRFKIPAGAAAIEVIYTAIGTGTRQTVGGSVTIGGTSETAVYARDLIDSEVNEQLFRYVNADGVYCAKEDAYRVLLEKSGLPPEVSRVKFRWWYDADTCTEWFESDTEVSSAIIDIDNVEPGTPYDYYY